MKWVRERLSAGAQLPRHRHTKPYVTLVVAGGYVEAGDQGRFSVGPGDVLVHAPFASHANWIAARSDVITLNIEVDIVPDGLSLGQAENFDRVVRLAQSDPGSATDELFTSLVPKTNSIADWPDRLAMSMRENPATPISEWCRWLGLAPGTVSRGFKRAFGVSPVQYRAAARAHMAYRQLTHSDMDLAELADACGYSDQAHLTRSIRALTGSSPTKWRKVKYLQDNDWEPQ